MKLLLWIVPSVVLIHFSGRRLRAVFEMQRLRPVLAWGVGTGLVLGVISLIAKAAMRRPLFALALSWPQFSVLVVAPALEEFMFRGAVLGNLMQRHRFPLANTLTAALFLGLHLPGWHFQGCLWTNLAAPVGGALSIFLLGWVFGLVAHRSKSVVASMIAHSLNNLFS
jgi:membrane protease YdiL (CAAX protease family)